MNRLRVLLLLWLAACGGGAERFDFYIDGKTIRLSVDQTRDAIRSGAVGPATFVFRDGKWIAAAEHPILGPLLAVPAPTASAAHTAGEVTMLRDVASFISAHPFAVVDFHADWCGPCRAFEPVYEEAARNRPAVAFGKVKEETSPEIFEKYEITSFPTQIFYRDGVEVRRIQGALLGTGDFEAVLDEILGPI